VCEVERIIAVRKVHIL